MSKICKKCGNESENDSIVESNCDIKRKKAPVFILIIIAIGIYAVISIMPSIIDRIGWITSFKVNDMALAYMEEKYRESFAYSRPTGNSMSGTRQILVKCDSLPGKEILVQVENFQALNRVFSDNYLAVKYQEETIQFFKDSASENFLNARVFYKINTSTVNSSELSAYSSFEEHLADADYKFIVMMELKASEVISKEQVEKMAKQISNNFKNMSFTIIIVDDSLYGTLDRKGLNKLISTRNFVQCARIYVENSDIKIDWMD